MDPGSDVETSRRRAITTSWVVTATGVLHLGLGAVAFWEPLTAMAAAGVWNSLGGEADRQAALWYAVGGGSLLSTGLSARWAVMRTGLLPPPLGWGLVAIAIVGAVVAPRSGFWLVLVEGVALAAFARRLTAGSRSDEVSRAAVH